MEKKLVSSQSAERAGAPANAGNDDQPLAFGLYDVPSTNGACFPGFGNAFRENPPKLRRVARLFRKLWPLSPW